MHQFIKYESKQSASGLVATVTVANEAMHNSLPAEGRRELAEVFGEVSALPDLRCVVLTGAGEKAFISGSNINQMAGFNSVAEAQAASFNTHLACDAIRNCPVPVIGRINGYCLGAGMIIAASCDMRIASKGSRFGMPEVKYGIPSAMETCLLPRLIGWGKTMQLVYTAQFMEDDEAHRLGFLQSVVDRAELDDAVSTWVDAILAAGPNAIRLQKQLTHDWERMGTTDAIFAGVQAIGAAHRTGEPKERILAFIQNRERKRLAST